MKKSQIQIALIYAAIVISLSMGIAAGALIQERVSQDNEISRLQELLKVDRQFENDTWEHWHQVRASLLAQILADEKIIKTQRKIIYGRTGR